MIKFYTILYLFIIYTLPIKHRIVKFVCRRSITDIEEYEKKKKKKLKEKLKV